jgi:hypothetical protein
MGERISAAYIDKCCKSTATLKKTQTNIAKQIQPRRTGDPLLKHEYKFRKDERDGNVHKSTEEEYEHTEQLW